MDKSSLEEELKNYREQLENQTNQPNDSFEEMVSQRIDSFLKDTDGENQFTSKFLSDIPASLHLVGITNYMDGDFSNSSILEKILCLCKLLIERCQVLQNNELSNQSLVKKNLFSLDQSDDSEHCQLLIHREDHPDFDKFFEHFQTWMNKLNYSNNWKIQLSKSNHEKYIRLELNDSKFIPEEIEHELQLVHLQLEKLSKENTEQQCEIITLKENLQLFEQVKQKYTDQCEKTNELEKIISQGMIDKSKFDQLESLYKDLQEKYLHLEHIKSDYDALEENFNKLNLLSEEQKEKYRTEVVSLQNTIEQQKQVIDNATQSQDERYLSSVKLTKQLSDLLETEKSEKEKLKEINRQLESDLKENNELFFEKSKQADDLDKQLQVVNNEYQNLKVQFDQIKDEKTKLANDINLLKEKIQKFDTEKSEYLQTIKNLKQDLENNKTKFDQTLNKNREQFNQEKLQMETHLKQTIESLKQELDSKNTEINNYQLEAIERKKLTLENEQNQANDLKSELEKFQQENEKLNQTIQELSKKLETQASESDATIQDLQEKQQKMKLLLSRLKKELQEKTQQPKQSLIDLEIADYEKTIKSLKENLTAKDKEIQDLRDEITSLNEKQQSLKDEIQNLDQQKLQTEERADKLKVLLDTTKRELQDAKDLEQQRYQNDDNLRSLFDKLQIELDNNKVTMSQLMAEKLELTERFHNQSETSQRTINLLEQNLRIAKHDLDIAKQDYDTLHDDFNNYKIRAQSVLKQKQSTQRERQPSIPDKQAELEETIEKLKINLQEANNKIQLLMSENELLQKEQDRLNEVQAKIISESRKREQELRKQHKTELDKVENDCLKRTNDNHDIMKSVALQNENLAKTYKDQIASIQADHERSVSMLQNQLQMSKQEIEQLKNRIESLRQMNVEAEKESSQTVSNNDVNKDDVSWNYSERQQGEGSESASVDHQPTDVAVKTLENVLFGNENSRGFSSSNMDKPRHILFEDVELERQRLEEELSKTKYRLLNTTELLNESELNNVRLSEQVSVLKDEIRRIERNMDRAESISNLEYLKNIILKFFILKSTHERLQIIPVLVTMLKLSPDEQAKLVRVAQQTASLSDASTNNESNPPQVANRTDSKSSWGSYLNIW